MAVMLPISVVTQYFNNQGVILAGGKIYTYTAGTTTPVATYTDSTLGTVNDNPIILDASGRTPNEMWVASGTSVKIVVTDSTGSQVGPTLDNIAGLNDISLTTAIYYGGTAGGTANALTLTFSGGPTSHTAGVRITFTASATNTGAATINPNGIGAKAIQRNGNALVGGEIVSGNSYEIVYTGTAYQLDAISPLTANRVDVASAATVNLDTAGSKYVRITGTTTITAITLTNGNPVNVVFGGSLVLTNGASLILPDGANITTGAGDTAIFIGEASGVVRCVSYQRALNDAGTVASAATVNLDNTAGDVVDISGTTTITAITLADGRRKTVRFTGSLTLTNGASLVLPGGANITTAIGDYAVFVGYAAGVVRCASYARSSAAPSGVLAAGGGLTTPADTTEDTLATITIPANSMGANGMIRVTSVWRTNNNANAKTARLRFSGGAGTQLIATNLANGIGGFFDTILANNNATNAQSGRTLFHDITAGTLTTAVTSTAITSVDTTASSTLVFTGQKGTAGDTLALDHYTVELKPSA